MSHKILGLCIAAAGLLFIAPAFTQNQGQGNPVSFQPYFDELTHYLRNQYKLGFRAPIAAKPEVETLKLKLSVAGADVEAPQQVVVVPAGRPGLELEGK